MISKFDIENRLSKTEITKVSITTTLYSDSLTGRKISTGSQRTSKKILIKMAPEHRPISITISLVDMSVFTQDNF